MKAIWTGGAKLKAAAARLRDAEDDDNGEMHDFH